MKPYREELKESRPDLVKRALKSKVLAIKLFCVECHGGSVESAGKCDVKDCFLWPHGPAGRKKRSNAGVKETDVQGK
jgi:hypothetical protein